MFTGETAEKTTQVINRSRGGTLLIDEAYQLMPQGAGRDFGIEAVEAIMLVTEGGDYTEDDRPALIFAGYPADMKRFLESNGGLARRLTGTFNFEDYTPVELFRIFVQMAKKSQFTVDVEEEFAVTQMSASFSLELCSRHNAGLSQKLLAASIDNVNARVFIPVIGQRVTDVAGMKIAMMLITGDDFVAACRKVQDNIY